MLFSLIDRCSLDENSERAEIHFSRSDPWLAGPIAEGRESFRVLSLQGSCVMRTPEVCLYAGIGKAQYK